ncbi:MAG: anthrone oxygenase family protein [Acidobacteriota bacterium]
MPSLHETATLLAAVGSGLVAGLCFAFASFIMRAFDRLGATRAILAMQAINTRILESSAMTSWFGTGLLGVAATVLADDRALVLASTALYAVGAFLITARGNVPLNEELDTVDPDGPDAEKAWRRYRERWGRWNALRTLACTLASAGFALAS